MLIPVPEVVIFPGVILIIHVPLTGNPFNPTLPVSVPLTGWVIVPINGAGGAAGCCGTTMFAEEIETQPSEFVTV